MNNNYSSTELLTRYLDGEIQGEELEQFKNNIRDNKNLQEELASLKVSVESIKSYGLYKEVGKLHSEMMKELQYVLTPISNGKTSFIKNTLRIAASIIIISGCLFLYQYFSTSSQSLFQNNFQAYTLSENRSIENKTAIEQEYKMKNYSRVIQLFEEIPVKSIKDFFIAGNAYLEQSNAPGAISCFKSIQEMNNSQGTHIYEDDAEYFLAMSYLQNNEPAKAIPLFSKIASDKSHLYHAKVNWCFLEKLHWANK